MIDLHTHSLFSDGELIPSELVQRAKVIGYSAIAITDHSDFSNLDFIVPRIVQVSEDLNRAQQVLVVPGIELTHVPPGSIGPLVEKARKLGAKLIIVHGETIVEPVPVGTNRAALEAGADILAHPGLISADDVKLAVEKGVFLEISARAGHSYTNGYVAKLANEAGAGLIINSDTHSPGNLMNKDFAEKVVEGAGLPAGSLSRLLSNARVLLEKIGCSI